MLPGCCCDVYSLRAVLYFKQISQLSLTMVCLCILCNGLVEAGACASNDQVKQEHELLLFFMRNVLEIPIKQREKLMQQKGRQDPWLCQPCKELIITTRGSFVHLYAHVKNYADRKAELLKLISTPAGKGNLQRAVRRDFCSFAAKYRKELLITLPKLRMII